MSASEAPPVTSDGNAIVEYEGDEERLLPPPQSWFGGDDVPDDANTIEEHSDQQEDTASSRTLPNPTPIDAQDKPPLESSSKIMLSVGAPRKAPSWSELSSQVLPAAAKELLSASMHRVLYTARISYALGKWHRRYSDLGNPMTGYYRSDLKLPPFSSLPWVDRQLVREWRTIASSENLEWSADHSHDEDEENDDEQFDQARTLIPKPLCRPQWQKADLCQECRRPFGPTLLRHHCRLCGKSYCQAHSNHSHKLPHLGYDPAVPERVCSHCKDALNEQTLAERIAWRLARCRDFLEGCLSPYFETGVDTVEDAALRITNAALAMARSIPLGAQAHVAVETVEVLRKYGLKGIYGLVFRKEFLAAADMLCRALGINKTAWPLSVHELSAAIFYALAQHRAMRGMQPEWEHLIHTLRDPDTNESTVESARSTWASSLSDETSVIDETDTYDPVVESGTDLLSLSDDTTKCSGRKIHETTELPFSPVCERVSDSDLSSVLFYAPIALNFIYAEKAVDMQLLAAQQGWRLLYSHLDQEPGSDRPGSALFVHHRHKIACFAIRGTATINDVVTDIRQMPVPFPDGDASSAHEQDGWTPVFSGQGLAVSGMARAASTLYREHIEVLRLLGRNGYKVRITGHSLGGGVATLLGALIVQHRGNDFVAMQNSKVAKNAATEVVRVFGFGTPACVDASLSDDVKSFVTTVVLHDDVVPRLTPTSIRGLLKHLLHIRETWVKTHLSSDLMAITERAKTAWAPRWRSGFTLGQTSLQKYWRGKIHYGKSKLMSVKGRIVRSMSQTAKRGAFVEGGSTQPGGSSSETGAKTRQATGERSDVEISHPVVDVMGALDSSTVALVVDGDEFYDTLESLTERDEKANLIASQPVDNLSLSDAQSVLLRDVTDHSGEDWLADDDHNFNMHLSFTSGTEGLEESEESSSAVVLEEAPLPRMYLPGKIIHIYTHRGGFKAAYVPRTFRELRRISLAGNMLSDHTCRAYYEAVLEVQTVRAAREGLPTWTPFDAEHTCSCCASRFTWASTSDSEAQEARDKHNCRSCGTLVCDPCSKNRIPIPSIGLTVAVRVCDMCYNDIGGATADFSAIDSDAKVPTGFINPTIAEQSYEADAHMERQPERQRPRRSSIVDELVSRIHSTVAVT